MEMLFTLAHCLSVDACALLGEKYQFLSFALILQTAPIAYGEWMLRIMEHAEDESSKELHIAASRDGRQSHWAETGFISSMIW